MLGQTGALLKPGAAFSPAAIPGLALWLVGNKSPLTMNGSAISQWDDFSGNGNHASQGTATKQPAHAGSDVGGLPAADFDGTNDILAVSAAASIDNLWAGGGKFFVVCNSDDTGTFSRIINKTKRDYHLNTRIFGGRIAGCQKHPIPSPSLESSVGSCSQKTSLGSPR